MSEEINRVERKIDALIEALGYEWFLDSNQKAYLAKHMSQTGIGPHGEVVYPKTVDPKDV